MSEAKIIPLVVPTKYLVSRDIELQRVINRLDCIRLEAYIRYLCYQNKKTKHRLIKENYKYAEVLEDISAGELYRILMDVADLILIYQRIEAKDFVEEWCASHQRSDLMVEFHKCMFWHGTHMPWW